MKSSYHRKRCPTSITSRYHQFKNIFLKNVRNLVNTIEELGNPFKEDSDGMLAIDTRDIMLMELGSVQYLCL